MGDINLLTDDRIMLLGDKRMVEARVDGTVEVRHRMTELA
jgi:hypothetical protein